MKINSSDRSIKITDVILLFTTLRMDFPKDLFVYLLNIITSCDSFPTILEENNKMSRGSQLDDIHTTCDETIFASLTCLIKVSLVCKKWFVFSTYKIYTITGLAHFCTLNDTSRKYFSKSCEPLDRLLNRRGINDERHYLLTFYHHMMNEFDYCADDCQCEHCIDRRWKTFLRTHYGIKKSICYTILDTADDCNCNWEFSDLYAVFKKYEAGNYVALPQISLRMYKHNAIDTLSITQMESIHWPFPITKKSNKISDYARDSEYTSKGYQDLHRFNTYDEDDEDEDNGDGYDDYNDECYFSE